jgi:hypothetical protein
MMWSELYHMLNMKHHQRADGIHKTSAIQWLRGNQVISVPSSLSIFSKPQPEGSKRYKQHSQKKAEVFRYDHSIIILHITQYLPNLNSSPIKRLEIPVVYAHPKNHFLFHPSPGYLRIPIFPRNSLLMTRSPLLTSPDFLPPLRS